MKLKKLIPELVTNIIDAGYDKEPTKIETLVIPKIKSRSDFYVVAPAGTGKSTAIAIGVIQQLKKAEEEVPRAIIMTATKEKAFEMEKLVKLLSRKTTLRSFVVFDEGIIQYQKDTIYEGLDILIGTPRRINELMSTTGIPMTRMQLLCVDDTEKIFSLGRQHIIYRVAGAIEKAQFVISANKWHDQFDKLTDTIMKSNIIITEES